MLKTNKQKSPTKPKQTKPQKPNNQLQAGTNIAV